MKMVEIIRDNISMTKNMDMECTHGLMERSMTVAGGMVNSTVKLHSQALKVNREWVSGKMENV